MATMNDPIINLVSPGIIQDVTLKILAAPIDLNIQSCRSPFHLKLELSPTIDLITPPQKVTCNAKAESSPVTNLVTPPQNGPHCPKKEPQPLQSKIIISLRHSESKKYKLSASPDITIQKISCLSTHVKLSSLQCWMPPSLLCLMKKKF